MDYKCTGIRRNVETYDFICSDCKSTLNCDVSFNGLCICEWCEPDFYHGIKKKIDLDFTIRTEEDEIKEDGE